MAGKTLIIHPHAVIRSEAHLEAEKKFVRIGSTMKGSGAAIIQRIERDPENNPTAEASLSDWFKREMEKFNVRLLVCRRAYAAAIREANLIQIEGAQGFSLSIYHGFYPYTTSRDVTPAQVLADTCIPASVGVEVYGTLRTLPIRVANRFDQDGNMIGTSGGCYPDQRELSWEEAGLEPELTTVTKLPRRLFSFSEQQLEEAIFQCAPDRLFLNFCNYLYPPELEELVAAIESKGVKIAWYGFGATKKDVAECDAEQAIGISRNMYQ